MKIATKSIFAIVSASFLASLVRYSPLATGQAYLGHEYEFEAAPIREDEKPLIPLDAGDPSYNS